MLKATPKQFPLTQSAMRLALIGGMLEGMVSAEEAKHHMLLDIEKRPHRKPVVAWGQYFPSTTAAAQWAIKKRLDSGSVDNVRQRIARKCNDDCWEGFYWSE